MKLWFAVRIYLFIDLYDNWIIIIFILVSGLCNILKKLLTILCNDLFIGFFFVIEE